MRPRVLRNPRLVLSIAAALLALLASACAQNGGASQAQLDAKQKEVTDLQKQLASAAPVKLVQAGQVAQPAAAATPTGWDTPESIRGGLKLVNTYDSSGPDAWDVSAHPLVYFTSEGLGYGSRPSKTNKLAGVDVIDANSYKVVASALFDLGGTPTSQPHGLGTSPDGKWVYIGFAQKTASGDTQNLVLIINARTLKLDKTLTQVNNTGWGTSSQRLHHVMGFTDWQGHDRVTLEFGFGNTGGPGFILDPKDDNRVWKAITNDNVAPQGHPYYVVDPTGKFLYISMDAPWISDSDFKGAASIAKLNLETGAVTVITGVGNHPIGMRVTADGKFLYVNDAINSQVYKIDNQTNKVVAHTSAGVAGNYGMVLNWDETELWTVGKGEGSHNTGGVLGVIDLKTFQPTNSFNQPVQTGGAIEDHMIVHPDPDRNEAWISSAGTFETIVVDLKTREVKARIPTASGGDTHNGAFVRYAADWAGTLLADHAGPKAELNKIRLSKVAAAQKAAAPAQSAAATPPAAPASASATPAASSRDALLAQGKILYEKTAGGVGCASCHGIDGKGAGTSGTGAPDIRGASEAKVRATLSGGVAAMNFIKLNENEMQAIVAYVGQLK